MDDFFEEQKLSSDRRISFPWQPEVWAGTDEVNAEGGEGGGGGGGEREGVDGGAGEHTSSTAHLRELLKTEREQKVISRNISHFL